MPIVRQEGFTTPEMERLKAENERLRAALGPFGRNADAVSLSEALGHICREDLLRARDALKPLR